MRTETTPGGLPGIEPDALSAPGDHLSCRCSALKPLSQDRLGARNPRASHLRSTLAT